MNEKRKDLYDNLDKMIGNTPLVEIKHFQLFNNCRVFAKCEFLNPTGSHHDRQYVHLFRDAELSGKIIPGETKLIEITSGCAGASFAWMANILGYDATIIVPSELPQIRIKSISKHGCKIIISNGKYINGCIDVLNNILNLDKKIYCMNHSRMIRSATSLANIAEESLRQEPKLNSYLALIGSGSSLLGPGQIFKNKNLEVMAWEPWGSGVAYDMQNPGEYKEKFGIEPGSVAHSIWGASFSGVNFPHVQEGIKLLSDRIVLISDNNQGTNHNLNLPKWDDIDINWPVGRSSLGGLAAIRKISESKSNKNFLTIFYDSGINY